MTTQDKGADAEIARLRKENEALRAALLTVAQWFSYHGPGGYTVPTDPGMTQIMQPVFDALGWPNPCPKDQAT